MADIDLVISANNILLDVGGEVKLDTEKVLDVLDTARFVEHEAKTTNGVIVTFNTDSAYVAGSLRVYIDGILQIKDADYTEDDDTTFTLGTAPDADENLWIGYITKVS